MSTDNSSIYESVLSGMGDGVISIDHGGHIITCNYAAQHILGLAGEDLLQRNFAEVFIAQPGLDAFNEILFAAIYERNEVGKQLIEAVVDDHKKLLAVNTTYFGSEDDEDDGSEHAAIVAVFTDVTELRELKESEAELARKVQSQYEELQTAYREMEENQEQLANSLHRVQMIRGIATAAVFVLFLVAVFYFVNMTSVDVPEAEVAATTTFETDAEGLQTYVVEPKRQISAVSVPSRLAPGRETPVTSPFGAALSAVHFRYGEQVEEGQLLIELHDAAIKSTHAERHLAFLDAKKQLQEFQDWEHSDEMITARRALSRTKQSLSRQQQQLKMTKMLFDQGVIPELEFEAAQDNIDNLLADFEDSQRALEAVQEKGSEEMLHIAEMKFQIADELYKEVADYRSKALVRAPVSGVVLEPPASVSQGTTGQNGEAQLVSGETVTEGQVLMLIANLDSLSASGSVNEKQITQLHVGQQVSATLDALPDMRLVGSLSSVASQASDLGGGGGSVDFDIEATFDGVTPEQRQQLRLGMSVDLSIVIRDTGSSLLVPLNAVHPDGANWIVRVLNRQTGEVRNVSVETGETTPESVEIVSGLSAGDEVVVSG